MSMTAEQIVARQDRILEEMSRIRAMVRGTLSWQEYGERAKRRGGKGAVGPYALWQGTVSGKRFCRRVTHAKADQVASGIEQRHAFGALCEEYVDLGCRLSELEWAGTASDDAVKKGLKSRSRRAGRSSG